MFEILYEIIYIFKFCLNKGMEWILFPMVLVFVITALVMPFINVCAAVTGSQGKVVERYIEETLSGKETASKDLASARSAYRVLDRDAGFEGVRFIEKLKKKYPDFDLEYELKEGYDYTDTVSHTEYYYADNDISVVETYGYTHLGVVQVSRYEEELDTSSIELYYREQEGSFAQVDLSWLFDKMMDLKARGADQEEFDKLIEEPILFSSGSKLCISYLSFEECDGVIKNLNINGYYLYK